MHDIIDNRNAKLADYILNFLPKSERGRFAVGYLFLSGLEALGSGLDDIEELRLLIGNTTNRETVEQLSEAYKRREQVEHKQDELTLATRARRQELAGETAGNLRETVALMDQTDAGQELVWSLVRMVEEGRLKVRVYTRGRLHAKAYIFDWSSPTPTDNGIAVVGSSNLTLSGIQNNTELNVLVHDRPSPTDSTSGNHGALVSWFEELWDESEDFDALLMTELRESWAAALASPHDIYLKTLYELVRDRLVEEEPTMLPADKIYEELADFQKVAVEQAIRIIERQRGCFVADVVGLGKSFIGAAITKYFERVRDCDPLIICPKSLEEMWLTYNAEYDLHAEVLPLSMLREGADTGVDLQNDPRYRNRDFILIDESHNFRNTDTQRYRELEHFINDGPGRRVCMLTATPRNSRARDVLNQMRFFHPDDQTDLPIDPPNLSQYFTKIEQDEERTGAENVTELQDVLRHVLIRRTRRHILRWYGAAEDSDVPLREMTDIDAKPYLDGARRAYVMVGGKRNFFPRRELGTLRYSIEDTYSGLYDELRNSLGRSKAASKPSKTLTYARYGLFNYVHPSKREQPPYNELRGTGESLRGLMRTMLFKRLESSVYAFRKTLQWMHLTHDAFLRALDDGIVPAGEQAENLLRRGNPIEDEDDFFDALRDVTGRYSTADLNVGRLREDLENDLGVIGEMIELISLIDPDEDDKLQELITQLNTPDFKDRKILIFTQYADTADYLYQNLDPGSAHDDIEVISGTTDKDKTRIVKRFAPNANKAIPARPDETEIRILIATDVLAEGLNLQDCDLVINYDLHWNPVRLIQRFGRIDRIGSEFDVIYGYNFLPERGIEKTLGIGQVLRNRIQEIHDTIGEDAYILDRTERLNENAMYAIYESQPTQLSFLPDEEEERYIDINEAEELLRQLRQENPEEFERIQNLRDGIRGGRPGGREQTYVFCRAGDYQRLYLVDVYGEVITSDAARILGTIKADETTPGITRLPANYNDRVMAIKHQFEAEVREREATQGAYRSTRAQSYIRQELRTMHAEVEDVQRRMVISVLERTFTTQRPTEALRRQINQILRSQMTGDALFNRLIELQADHDLRNDGAPLTYRSPSEDVPRIVCSMAFV